MWYKSGSRLRRVLGKFEYGTKTGDEWRVLPDGWFSGG